MSHLDRAVAVALALALLAAPAVAPVATASASDQFLRGVVERQDGTPLDGVTVEIVDTDTGSVVETVTTRSDGTWGRIAFPEGNYTAEVSDDLGRSFSTQVQLEDLETERIETVVEQTTGQLRGTVTDDDGDPLSGATVTVTNASTGSTVGTFGTGSGGGWGPTTVPAGRYEVTTAANGYFETTTTAQVSEGATARVDQSLSASLSVRIASTNAPVTVGDPLRVEATVENRGSSEATTDAALTIDGGEAASRSLTLGAGETRRVTLSWPTDADDAGSYTAGVETVSDDAATRVDVAEPGPPSVAVRSTNAPVTAGETLRVEATVENGANVSRTERVSLAVAGAERASRSLDLGPEERRVVTLRWSNASAGDHTATVAAGGGQATRAVVVQAPASVTAAVAGTNGPVAPGETLAVDVRLTNDGDVTATRNLTLLLDGATRTTTTVALAPGAERTVTLSTTAPDTAGSYEVRVGGVATGPTATVTVSTSGPTETPTPTESPAPTTGTETPSPSATTAAGAGFGPVAALTAVVVALVARRRASR